MKEHKRIVLVGPTCSGKTFIREKFRQRGYEIDISYTSREPRKGEINGIDYKFVSEDKFMSGILNRQFYEFVKYGDNYYGTGLEEWNECDVFIMETDGVSKIKREDRPNCLVIFVNTPLVLRTQRMRERGWDIKKIMERIKVDQEKFKDFINYDFQISSVCENG